MSNTCRAVSISRQCYYDWLAKDSSFAEVIEEIAEGTKDDLEELIWDVAKGEYKMVYSEEDKEMVKAVKTRPDTTLLIFLAKTKMKDRGYIERTEQVQFDGNIKVKTEEGVPADPKEQEVPEEILKQYKNQ